jgi:hypothetical protein
MTSFEAQVTSVNRYLSARYDAAFADEVCEIARSEYRKLVPQLPNIGGQAHPGYKYLLLAAQWVAFLRPMNARGHGPEETARMMYDIFVADLENAPRKELTRQGELFFSNEYTKMMQTWCAHSKTQQTGDWVVDFIPGEGDRFDHGLDFHYCPCVEFFKFQGAESIAPYFCLLDFAEHRLMGTGLRRTKTLAEGDEICDFRYKKGRAVSQDWSTEVPRFKT